jgi:predicted nuclease with TOPRIM domain
MVSKSGENYLTISYERLAPVFVEAIKELKKDKCVLNEKYDNLLQDITLLKQKIDGVSEGVSESV